MRLPRQARPRATLPGFREEGFFEEDDKVALTGRVFWRGRKILSSVNEARGAMLPVQVESRDDRYMVGRPLPAARVLQHFEVVEPAGDVG